MEITLLDSIHGSLDSANEALAERFLKKHMNGTGGVDEFKLDTRSYCVLLHAALEGFVEDVSLFVAKYSFHLLKNTGEITIPLMFLLNGTKTYDDRFVVKGGKDSKVDSEEDNSYIKKHVIEFILDCEVKTKIKWRDVITSNHGIKSKHLNAILQSVGIHCDIDNENFSSWKTFSSFRGSFAHTSETYLAGDAGDSAIKELSPEYAFKYGCECVEYGKTIIDEAKKILSGKDYVKEYIENIQQQRLDKAKRQSELDEKRKEEEEKASLEEAEKKKRKAQDDEKKRDRIIYLTEKLDLLLQHINSDPEKYADLHTALFTPTANE